MLTSACCWTLSSAAPAFEVPDPEPAWRAAADVLSDDDDAPEAVSAFCSARLSDELERAASEYAASRARSVDLGHKVWESHMRELTNDTIDPAHLRRWADLVLVPCAAAAPAISLTDLWTRYTCETGRYCCRGLFGALLRRALGPAGRHLTTSRAGCDCNTPWSHLHNFAWRVAPPADADLGATMLRIIARKQFEQTTDGTPGAAASDDVAPAPGSRKRPAGAASAWRARRLTAAATRG